MRALFAGGARRTGSTQSPGPAPIVQFSSSGVRGAGSASGLCACRRLRWLGREVEHRAAGVGHVSVRCPHLLTCGFARLAEQITGKKMHSTLWYLQHSPA